MTEWLVRACSRFRRLLARLPRDAGQALSLCEAVVSFVERLIGFKERLTRAPEPLPDAFKNFLLRRRGEHERVLARVWISRKKLPWLY